MAKSIQDIENEAQAQFEEQKRLIVEERLHNEVAAAEQRVNDVRNNVQNAENDAQFARDQRDEYVARFAQPQDQPQG